MKCRSNISASLTNIVSTFVFLAVYFTTFAPSIFNLGKSIIEALNWNIDEQPEGEGSLNDSRVIGFMQVSNLVLSGRI